MIGGFWDKMAFGLKTDSKTHAGVTFWGGDLSDTCEEIPTDLGDREHEQETPSRIVLRQLMGSLDQTCAN